MKIINKDEYNCSVINCNYNVIPVNILCFAVPSQFLVKIHYIIFRLILHNANLVNEYLFPCPWFVIQFHLTIKPYLNGNFGLVTVLKAMPL